MKAYKILTLLVFTSLFAGCSKNDDTTASVPTLDGQWKLVNVRGGFAGVNDTFPAGQIKWFVDTASQTVTVINNNTNPNSQDILETGVYSYNLAPDPNSICINTFNVNNMDLGCFTLTDNEFTITYEYADGFTLTLIR